MPEKETPHRLGIGGQQLIVSPDLLKLLAGAAEETDKFAGCLAALQQDNARHNAKRCTENPSPALAAGEGPKQLTATATAAAVATTTSAEAAAAAERTAAERSAENTAAASAQAADTGEAAAAATPRGNSKKIKMTANGQKKRTAA